MLKYVLVILFGYWLKRFGLALGLFESIFPKDGFQFGVLGSVSPWERPLEVHLKSFRRKVIFLTWIAKT